LSGGCELKLCIGIDFTASNGNPKSKKSLHHINKDGSLNEYEKAIQAVGSILIKYDSDQRVPVRGFGVKQDKTKFNSFLIGDNTVNGVDGILYAYRDVIQKKMTMSKSRDWTFLIAKALAMSEKNNASRQTFTVLLILSNGSPSDMSKTIIALNQARFTPMSVVVVGVGGANFKELENSLLGDIATFVNYRKHSDDNSSLSRIALSRIPAQLVQYFTKKNIEPLPNIDDRSISLAPESLAPSDTTEKSFLVKIPEGANVGCALHVTNPFNGQLIKAVIPEGMMPGQHLEISDVAESVAEVTENLRSSLKLVAARNYVDPSFSSGTKSSTSFKLHN